MKIGTKEKMQRPPLWMYLAAYVIPYTLLVSIALFWPSHSSPLGFDFTHSKLVRMVPSISSYVDKSSFPHATAAYFACSGVLVLPFLVMALANPMLAHGSPNRSNANYRKYKATRTKIWLALALAVPIGIWITWIQPGYQIKIIPIKEQRWALAFFGMFFSHYWVTCYLIVGLRMNIDLEARFQIERKNHGME